MQPLQSTECALAKKNTENKGQFQDKASKEHPCRVTKQDVISGIERKLKRKIGP